MNRMKKYSWLFLQSWDSCLLCSAKRGMHLQSSASLRESVQMRGETFGVEKEDEDPYLYPIQLRVYLDIVPLHILTLCCALY